MHPFKSPKITEIHKRSLHQQKKLEIFYKKCLKNIYKNVFKQKYIFKNVYKKYFYKRKFVKIYNYKKNQIPSNSKTYWALNDPSSLICRKTKIKGLSRVFVLVCPENINIIHLVARLQFWELREVWSLFVEVLSFIIHCVIYHLDLRWTRQMLLDTTDSR